MISTEANLRPTDAELEEFLQLQKTEKELQKRMTEIKTLCKIRGSFCTERYACAVYEQEQTRLVGLAEAAKALGMDTLLNNDLVKVIEFCVVKIARRL